MLTNTQALRAGPNMPMAAAYRALLADTTHEELCRAYWLDEDTHYSSIVRMAIAMGDYDPDTGETT